MSPVLSPMPKYVLNIPLSFANETGVFKSEYSLVSCFSSHLILLSSDSPIGTPYQSISEEDPRTEFVPLIPNDLQTPTVMNM